MGFRQGVRLESRTGFTEPKGEVEALCVDSFTQRVKREQRRGSLPFKRQMGEGVVQAYMLEKEW